MIVKGVGEAAGSGDPRRRAGEAAERQMAFYLHRAFAEDAGVWVLHDLRLVDGGQPEADGSAGVCQIDHLLVHRWGVFIVESKSVRDEVVVRPDGSGGEEWTRRVGGREQGFASPIAQARRQAAFLRALLQSERAALLGKVPMGLRTIAKIAGGSEQRGFKSMPMQIVVAIADGGRIRRADGWREPNEAFRLFVCKADQVVEKIRAEIGKHRSASGLLSASKGDYGIWQMSEEEAAGVAAFLASRHTPRAAAAARGGADDARAGVLDRTSSARPVSQAVCKACGGTTLEPMSGRYGCYWKCACGVNTAMALVCGACGAATKRGEDARVRVVRAGGCFRRVCAACGGEEVLARDGG